MWNEELEQVQHIGEVHQTSEGLKVEQYMEHHMEEHHMIYR